MGNCHSAPTFRNGRLGTEAEPLLLQDGIERGQRLLPRRQLRWRDVNGGVYLALLGYDLLNGEW